MWIRPLFTIIPFNSIYFHQIGKFGIIFDMSPCEINDLAVSTRHIVMVEIWSNLDVLIIGNIEITSTGKLKPTLHILWFDVGT